MGIKMKIGSLKKFLENNKHPINSKAIVYNGEMHLTDGVQVINFPFSTLFKKERTIFSCNIFEQKPGDDLRKLTSVLKETYIPQGLYLFNSLFNHSYTQTLLYDLQPVLDFLQISINLCDDEYTFRKFYLALFNEAGIHLELHDKIPYADIPKYGDSYLIDQDVKEEFYLDPVRIVQILAFYQKEFNVSKFSLKFNKNNEPVYFYFPENKNLKALLMPILKYKKSNKRVPKRKNKKREPKKCLDTQAK